jgi:hypothetical protein
MIKFTSLLNELIMTDLTTSKDSKNRHFMVHKGKLFIFDEDSNVDRALHALKDHPEFKYISKNVEDVYDFLTAAAEAGPDVLVGDWYPDR